MMRVLVSVHAAGPGADPDAAAIAHVADEVADADALRRFLAGPAADGLARQLRRHEVERRLGAHMEALARMLLPDVAARRGPEVKAAPPHAAAGAERTLTIMVGGLFAGRWHDFASGKSGGPLELFAWARPSVRPVEHDAEAFLVTAEAGASGTGSATGPDGGGAEGGAPGAAAPASPAAD